MSKRTLPPEPQPPLVAAHEAPPCLYLRMRLATRRLLALYEARLDETGLSMAQFTLLAALAEEPEPTMSRLAELRELSPSTLTRTLRPLEHHGLIELVADAGNRRLRRVRLTREGRQRLRVAYAAWKRAQAEAEDIVPAKAVEQVLRATEGLPR
jgi:DNA-binding MarR family transcriptional regulator